jgi:hypothetical protein
MSGVDSGFGSDDRNRGVEHLDDHRSGGNGSRNRTDDRRRRRDLDGRVRSGRGRLLTGEEHDAEQDLLHCRLL